MIPANQCRTIIPNARPAENNTCFLVGVPHCTTRGAVVQLDVLEENVDILELGCSHSLLAIGGWKSLYLLVLPPSMASRATSPMAGDVQSLTEEGRAPGESRQEPGDRPKIHYATGSVQVPSAGRHVPVRWTHETNGTWKGLVHAFEAMYSQDWSLLRTAP